MNRKNKNIENEYIEMINASKRLKKQRDKNSIKMKIYNDEYIE